ncbi:MAG: hypothetical protein KatS3mg101_0778 [Patescibacteria group bacterium]|nr:MAG: hypothetical protein KatS3mg101_0778 [Patescibacteria group bacterium]
MEELEELKEKIRTRRKEEAEMRAETARIIWTRWRNMQGQWRDRTRWDALKSSFMANPTLAQAYHLVRLMLKPVKREE